MQWILSMHSIRITIYFINASINNENNTVELNIELDDGFAYTAEEICNRIKHRLALMHRWLCLWFEAEQEKNAVNS